MQFESPEEMKALILKLHGKAFPWPEGLNLGDGWFRWRLRPVDMVKKETPDDREGVTVEALVAPVYMTARCLSIPVDSGVGGWKVLGRLDKCKQTRLPIGFIRWLLCRWRKFKKSIV